MSDPTLLPSAQTITRTYIKRGLIRPADHDHVVTTVWLKLRGGTDPKMFHSTCRVQETKRDLRSFAHGREVAMTDLSPDEGQAPEASETPRDPESLGEAVDVVMSAARKMAATHASAHHYLPVLERVFSSPGLTDRQIALSVGRSYSYVLEAKRFWRQQLRAPA